MCDRLLAPPLPNLFLSSSIGIEFQLGTQPSIWRLHFLFPVVAGCGHVTPFSSIECWRKQCVHFLYYLLYKKKKCSPYSVSPSLFLLYTIQKYRHSDLAPKMHRLADQPGKAAGSLDCCMENYLYNTDCTHQLLLER